MNFGMTQAVIKCFERSTVERIKENSNDVSEAMSQALFIYTIMVINTHKLEYDHDEMSDKQTAGSRLLIFQNIVRARIYST